MIVRRQMKDGRSVTACAAAIAGGYGLFLLFSESAVNAAAPVTVTVVERIPAGPQAKRKATARRPAPAVGSPEDLSRRYQVPVTETAWPRATLAMSIWLSSAFTINVDKSAMVSRGLPSKVACTPGVTTSPG